MKSAQHAFFKTLALAVTVLLVASDLHAGSPAGSVAMPDLTQGDKIPEGATHDWNLGPTGARGWIYSHRLETSDARQIYVAKVAEGSPADGVLLEGDVILGAFGKPFPYDARTCMGKVITYAESKSRDGNLRLVIWRDGTTQEVVVKLPVLGDYSATAPYDCPKSKRILEQGCKALALRVAGADYKQNPITRSLNALALLASGNHEYLPLVKKEVEWASEFSAGGMQTWYYGYVIMLLSEYKMATGDDSYMPGLRRLCLEAANGQSIVGSWGHKFAGDDGRLLGYGMMNAPGLPLTTSLVLARKAGVDDPKVAEAIEKSARLLRFYIGKGAIPYGDHHPWIETHEDNGKCGMAAVLFNQLDEPTGAEFFSKMSVASHGAERDTGHTGNFFNIAWSLPGVAQSGPHATGAWMREFGAWYFDLARSWDGTYQHQGPPEMRSDSYPGWDATGAYLLAYAMPLNKIYLTGKEESNVPQLDAETAKALISDGRGWSNNDRNSYHDKLSDEQLIERLSSWSPVVRERAAMALSRRDATLHIPLLIEMLDAPRVETQIGTCQALAKLRGRAAPAVDALAKCLKHDDMWLRIKAAEALAVIGQPAMPIAPELLAMLAKGSTPSDPRGMEQRYLCFALFNQRGGMLGGSLDGVDREALHEAVLAGLSNEDGRARGSIGSVYQNLSYDEIKPLLGAIHEAIVTPAPSGIMFADGIRTSGLKLFVKHRISEGIELLADYARNQKPHASEKRIVEVMEMLKTYGAHAQRVIPQLEETANYFENDEPDFPKHLSLYKAGVVREAIKEIEASKDSPTLIRITTP